MDKPMAEVVQRIDEGLKRLRLSKRALATHLGVTPQSVNGWFHAGKAPSRELIPRIAEYLEMTSDYLLTGESASPTLEDADVLEQLDHIAQLVGDLRRRISARAAGASPGASRGAPKRPALPGGRRPSSSSDIGPMDPASLDAAFDEAGAPLHQQPPARHDRPGAAPA